MVAAEVVAFVCVAKATFRARLCVFPLATRGSDIRVKATSVSFLYFVFPLIALGSDEYLNDDISFGIVRYGRKNNK